jgi:Domain of unknown function (DUF4395)
MDSSCPISDTQLNEKSIRIGAGLVLCLTVFAIIFHNIWIVILLAIDFFIRGFTRYPISPVSFISKFIVKVFPFKPSLVNAGPKIFAAKIGFLFCLTVSILYFKNLYLPGDIVAAVLCVCAGLESFLSVCLGCHFYTILLKLRNAY